MDFEDVQYFIKQYITSAKSIPSIVSSETIRSYKSSWHVVTEHIESESNDIGKKFDNCLNGHNSYKEKLLK